MVNVKYIPSLEFSEQAFLFLSIGGKWGLDMPWDVPIQTKSQPINVTMKPGQTGECAGRELIVRPAFLFTERLVQQWLIELKILEEKPIC